MSILTWYHQSLICWKFEERHSVMRIFRISRNISTRILLMLVKFHISFIMVLLFHILHIIIILLLSVLELSTVELYLDNILLCVLCAFKLKIFSSALFSSSFRSFIHERALAEIRNSKLKNRRFSFSFNVRLNVIA